MFPQARAALEMSVIKLFSRISLFQVAKKRIIMGKKNMHRTSNKCLISHKPGLCFIEGGR